MHNITVGAVGNEPIIGATIFNAQHFYPTAKKLTPLKDASSKGLVPVTVIGVAPLMGVYLPENALKEY